MNKKDKSVVDEIDDNIVEEDSNEDNISEDLSESESNETPSYEELFDKHEVVYNSLILQHRVQ